MVIFGMSPGEQTGTVIYFPIFNLDERTIGEVNADIEKRVIKTFTILVMLANGDLTDSIGILIAFTVSNFGFGLSISFYDDFIRIRRILFLGGDVRKVGKVGFFLCVIGD